MLNNYLLAQHNDISIDKITASNTLDIFDFTYLIVSRDLDTPNPFDRPLYMKYVDGKVRDTLIELLIKVMTFKKLGAVGKYSMTAENLASMFKEEVETPGTYTLAIDKYTNHNNLILLSLTVSSVLFWRSQSDKINAGMALYNSQLISGFNDSKFRFNNPANYYSAQYKPVIRNINLQLLERINIDRSKRNRPLHPLFREDSPLMEGLQLLRESGLEYYNRIQKQIRRSEYSKEDHAAILFATLGVTNASLFGKDSEEEIIVVKSNYYRSTLPEIVRETLLNPELLNKDLQETLEIYKKAPGTELVRKIAKLAINCLMVHRYALGRITLLDFLILNSRTLRGYLTSFRDIQYTGADGISYSILRSRLSDRNRLIDSLII